MICRWRFIFAFLGFTGGLLVYMLRVNLSVAIVAMVNSTDSKKANFTPECQGINETQNIAKWSGEFSWSENNQTLVLSSFFWGYALMQLPSGILVLHFNSKWIYGLSTLATSILTFLIPLAANNGIYAMIVLRFLMGIFEGPTYPALYALSGRWVLPKESSIVISFIQSGSTIGTIIGQSVTGFIIQQWGWRWAFYSMGAFGCVWFFIFALLVYDKPMNHPFIGEYERKLLINSLPHNSPEYKSKMPKVPWKNVFTSKPFIGYLIFTTSYNFTWNLMIICLPLYIGNVLRFNIKENGAISSLPFIAFLITGLSSSAIQDYIRSKNVISTTKLRKAFACFGLVLSAMMLCCILFTGCDITLTIALLVLTIAMLGLSSGVNAVNLLDLAPVYSGSLLAVVNVFNSISGIIAPFIKNFYTEQGETRANWGNVFIASSTILVFGALVFLLFGSASMQPWANLETKFSQLLECDNSNINSVIEDDK